ncbi:hypothetical protein IMSAGC007_01984 [Lachnospiraceae bacterium]|nr:hypothetical protein IMSAGC007_01984 [Lachnospiraceae bacterium]
MKNRNQLALGFLLGAATAGICLLSLQQHCINSWMERAEKSRGLFRLMDQWVNVKQEKKNIDEYFRKYHYKRIAIYGMGYVGQRLLKELKNSEVEIAYGIDRNAENIDTEIKMVTIKEELADIDAVVITLIDEFDGVKEVLSEQLSCPIIAIEDIINEIS